MASFSRSHRQPGPARASGPAPGGPGQQPYWESGDIYTVEYLFRVPYYEVPRNAANEARVRAHRPVRRPPLLFLELSITSPTLLLFLLFRPLSDLSYIHKSRGIFRWLPAHITTRICVSFWIQH